jgi:hypothetical protein
LKLLIAQGYYIPNHHSHFAEEHDLSYQEVAEYDGKFEEAVTGGVILMPELMTYNEWIAWRKV